MDKNTVIGLILMAAVLIGFSFWNTSQQPEMPAQTEQVKPSAQTVTPVKEQSASAAVAVKDSSALFFASAQGGEAGEVVLQNDKVQVSISRKGGLISDVRLKEYKSYSDFNAGNDAPLHLYSAKDAALQLVFETKEANIDVADYYFTVANLTDSTVTMTLSDSIKGAAIHFDYALNAAGYLVDFKVRTEGMKDVVSAKNNNFLVRWTDRVRQLEKGFYFENMYSTLTYKLAGGDTEKLSEMETEEKAAEGDVSWVAFKNQYFSSVLIAKQAMKEVQLGSVQEDEEAKTGYLKNYSAEMTAAFDPTGGQASEFQFYFGPNNYRLLQTMDEHSIAGDDSELEELVYLGWPLFKWINRYFTIYVFDFLTRLHLPMGVVLLLITILLRFIVYVPTKKSFMSSAKMRVLKPKVDEIAKKYPKQEDAMRRQQETMTLYSQYGVSPMGGCLPMLIQMPIWIAMFNFVPNAIELRQQGFLWADDLSTYDDLISWGVELPFIGNHLSLFCLLFCATNILYSYMSMRQQRDTMSAEQAQQMKIMQWMMYLMPVFFFFMFNKYSAGLNYYYFISLLASALTMWYLRKTTDDAKLLAKLEENYKANKNNPNKKVSGLAARLEALQKQQEAMMEAQKRKNNQ